MPTLTIQQAATYAKNAGFTGNDLVTILAIAMAESNLNTDVVNGIGATGILQIYLKAHPNVTSAQAKDPQFSFNYGYKLWKARGNFCDWQSYDCKICGNCGPNGWDGRYTQYLPQVQAALGSTNAATTATKNYKQGAGNPFDPTFRGQCTWWAQARYHELTGLWTPCTGNAGQWAAQAKAAGWETGSTPPNGIPSIICLQGNAGQGVTPGGVGHVAIVESINTDGSVITSNMNWAAGSAFNADINTYGYRVTTITFKPGTGVSFIWTGNAKTSDPNNPNGDTGGSASGSYGSYMTLLEQVHETLVNIPGFYGMALAIDEAEQFPGWIDLTDSSKTWDITGYMRSFGASVTDNFVPFMIRSSLVILGSTIILLLIARALSDVAGPVLSIAKVAA